MSDAFYEYQLAALGESFLRLVDDRPGFARAMSRRFALLAEVEERIGRRPVVAMNTTTDLRDDEPHADRTVTMNVTVAQGYEPDPAEPEV